MVVGHNERGLPVGFLLFDMDRFWEEQQRGEGARCAGAPPAPVTLQLGAGGLGRMALSSAGTEVSWFHKKKKLKEFVFLILQKERPRGDVSSVYKYIRWQEPVRRIKLKSRWI